MENRVINKYKYCILESGDTLENSCYTFESKFGPDDYIFVAEEIAVFAWYHGRCDRNSDWPLTFRLYSGKDELIDVVCVDISEWGSPLAFYARRHDAGLQGRC